MEVNWIIWIKVIKWVTTHLIVVVYSMFDLDVNKKLLLFIF